MKTPEFIRIRNYIDGSWSDPEGAGTIPLFNPSDGRTIGEVPLSTAAASTAAIASAHAAYDPWRRLPIGRRVKYLFDLRRAMEEHREELAFAIAIDQAKHISEARGEVQRVIEIIETACSIPTLIQGETLEQIGANIVGRVVRQPLGVFCGVAPFNFPALVFGWFIPFAIGVGNTFVFKPSPQSPYFMQKICEIFGQIGLPPGVVNVVNGDHAPTVAWYEDPRVRGICMVGSSPTARKIAEAAGRAGKRTMLLGGAKNYLVAMEDLQWDVFMDNYLNSCYGSAGQRCLAGSIVAAVPAIHDELVERIVAASTQNENRQRARPGRARRAGHFRRGESPNRGHDRSRCDAATRRSWSWTGATRRCRTISRAGTTSGRPSSPRRRRR